MGHHERASTGHGRRLGGIPPRKPGVGGSEWLAVEEVGVRYCEAGAAGHKHRRAIPQFNPCERRRRAVLEGKRRRAVLAIENDALLGLLRPPLQAAAATTTTTTTSV